MSATNQTPTLKLSQFIGSDIPAWLTDYNSDMSKIDNGVKQTQTGVAGAEASIAENEKDIADLKTTTQNQATQLENLTSTVNQNKTDASNAFSQVSIQAKTNSDNITKLDDITTSLETRIENLEDAPGVDPTLADKINKNTSDIESIDAQLTANNVSLYMDYQDGKYGVNTDPNRGADTFIPFSGTGAEITITTSGNVSATASATRNGSTDDTSVTASCAATCYINVNGKRVGTSSGSGTDTKRATGHFNYQAVPSGTMSNINWTGTPEPEA